MRDYNYRTPMVDLSANAKSTGELGERYEHDTHVKTPGEATELAHVRAEELGWQRSVFEGRSTRPELMPGMRFTLEGHPVGDKELLVIDVEHRLKQPTFLSQGTSADTTYENRFRAIAASVPFRPQRRTPKPFVPGVLTGIVEAAQAGEYAEIDDEGRYRVRFLFDTGSAQRGKASRPIRMAQPHAGPGYGFHFPLRDGVEVVLSCVEGDPDRPIIAGAVPNPTTPSTVVAKNSKRNVIRTGGRTEINIDDNDKGERLKISVPYGNTILQLGSPNVPEEGIYLGTDKKVHVTSSDGMLLEDDTKIAAHAPSTLIHGTTDATLEGNAIANVKSGAHVVVAAPTISGHAGALHETTAPVITANADGVWSAASGGIAVLSAGGSLAVGSPLIQINGATISVNGDTITIAATGKVTISGGGSVNIEGPTVKISGGVVDVHGGPIKLNS